MVNKRGSKAAKAAKLVKKSTERSVEKSTENAIGDVMATRSSKRRSDQDGLQQNKIASSNPKKRKLKADVHKNQVETPVSESEIVAAESDHDDEQVCKHAAPKVRNSADGRSTNITFEEGNDFVDMEVSGDLTTDASDHAGTIVSEDSSESSESDDEVQVQSQSDKEIYHEQGDGDLSTTRSEDSDSPQPRPKKKKKKKQKVGHRKRKEKQMAALLRMKKFMLKKGLVDSDISDSELESMLDSDFDADSLDGEKVSRGKRKTKR